MIAIVDYGMGNLRSVSKALEKVGGEVLLTGDPDAVRRADKVLLPGVGAFRDAIANLASAGLDEAVREAVRAGKPFLGVCLGQQLLFETSYEDGVYKGLGILPGEVVRFSADPSRPDLKIPADGLEPGGFRAPAAALRGHPFGDVLLLRAFIPRRAAGPRIVAGETEYLGRFASVVWRDNVLACQFHPEKSQHWGLKVLENFVRL